MFHTRDGLRLTPAYDLVASSVYPDFQSIALGISGIQNLSIGQLKPKHLLQLSKGIGLSDDVLLAAVEFLGKNLPSALDALSRSTLSPKGLRDQLSERIEKRWNGSFKLTGQLSSKKRGKGAGPNV
jgi:serine/threonine protein kinase HipA of HipAB toxin-antitoxin module